MIWKNAEYDHEPSCAFHNNGCVFVRKNIQKNEDEKGIRYSCEEAYMSEYEYELYNTVEEMKAELSELKSFVNSIGKTELVGEGTADNPFKWYDGIELIPNAYYTHNGVRYVWMGKQGISHTEPKDIGGDWAEF
mgnify:CR=1 FL=1